MAGYIGSKAVSVNTTSATISDDLSVGDDLTVTDDATIGGTLGVTGVLTATSLDISGDIDVDGTTNLDVVDIDGAVNMATTALVTGVLTTTAATVFNGGFASNANSTVGGKLETSANNNNGAKANYIRITDTDTTATANNQQGGIEFYTNDVTPGIAASIEVLYAGSGGGGEITFNTNVNSQGTLTEAVRIDENGLVGIGTDSPLSKLHIENTSSNDGIRIINSTSGEGFVIFGDTADSNTGSIAYNHSSDAMTFDVNNSERMRIDSSGVVRIGGQTGTLKLGNNGTYHADIEWEYNNNELAFTTNNVGNFTFNSNGSERMRIDSSGNVLVGLSSTEAVGTSVGLQLKGSGVMYAAATSDGSVMSRRSTNGTILQFRKDTTPVGSISVTASATAYNTSSDYRLKTDAQPMTGATARLKALNPVNFEWIADGERVDGFLAHEAQAIVPEAVTGTKDEVDDDGVAVMQGIDQSKLVPLLVKTIQELEARITALEG